MSQAHVTGQYLKKYLTQGNYQKIILESSPILRTLETAAAIAHELGINEIRTNYRCFEWLKQEFFENGSPADDILFSEAKTAAEKQAFVRDRLGYPDL